MAKRVVTWVQIIDDLDGRELPRGEGQTIRYGWRGTEYEIDLSEQHASELDTMMSNLVSKSQKVGRMLPHRPTTPGRGRAQAVERGETASSNTPAPPPVPPVAELPSGDTPSAYQQMMADRNRLKEVRAWARENGWPDHPATGQIRPGVREAWNAAHPDRPAPAQRNWHDYPGKTPRAKKKKATEVSTPLD